MTIKRPDPVRCSLDDLIGSTVVNTAYIHTRFDDRGLVGILDDKGRVWLAGGDDHYDQEDRAFVELGLWTAEEAKQFRQQEAAAARTKAQEDQLARDRATFERLKKQFEPLP